MVQASISRKILLFNLDCVAGLGTNVKVKDKDKM